MIVGCVKLCMMALNGFVGNVPPTNVGLERVGLSIIAADGID